MNRHQKKVLALAGAVANLSFSIAVAGVATFAWFSNNRTVSATGMSVRSTGKNIEFSYTILKYNDDLKKGEAYYNDPSKFVLPDYDQYIRARNVYSNIVIRADLTFNNTLNTANNEIFIDIKKDENSTLKSGDVIRLLTSNVIQFKCIATSYTLNTEEQPTVIPVGISEVQGSYKDVEDAEYRTAIQYFASRKTPTTFISLMNGQPVDPENGNTIRLVPELFNVGIIKHAVIYLECSYNEKLVDGFVADHPDGSIHDLEGDIKTIEFGVHSVENSQFGQTSTGKYLKMTEYGGSYDGVYLPAYIVSESKQALDGKKTTGAEAIGISSGINTNNNQLNIGVYTSTDYQSVYASDRIDDAAFEFDRKEGTFKSDNGHYIGNNTTDDGIISSTNDENLHNSLTYSNGNANIKSSVNSSRQLKYDTANSKFAYFNDASNNDIELYRYHENAVVSASLTGFVVTGPTGANAQYSVGEYFTLNGVSCVATYTRPNNHTFTVNVTSICTYTTVGEGTLIPGKTQFESTNNNKVINVSYEDRGETKVGSYNISVIADVLQYIEISSPATHTTFTRGDPFDISGLVVTGTFDIAGVVDVTSECVFYIGGNTYLPNQALNVGGNNLVVTIHYGGTSTLGDFYSDKTYKITVYNFQVNITESNKLIDNGSSFTLHVDFNGHLDWSIISDTNSVSFSSSELDVEETTAYTGSNYEMQSTTITIYGRAPGLATVRATINGTSLHDDCIIRVRSATATSATYTVASKTTVTTTGTVPQDSSATYHQSYNTAGQMTDGNGVELELTGYDGYKIVGIKLNMKSNSSKGKGYFTADVNNSVIASIGSSTDSKGFNEADWHGSWSTEYVDVEPCVYVDKVIGTGEKVSLVIQATESSLYIYSFTIYYEQGEVAAVTSLVIKDGDTTITNENPKVITSGSLDYEWTPNAIVTYEDNSHNSLVTWEILSGTGISIVNSTTGKVKITTETGTATIKATTVGMNSLGQHVEAQYTINWSGLHLVLQSISITGQQVTFNVGDTFTLGANAVVTATYTNGSTDDVTGSQNLTHTTPDMSISGPKTITITYVEGGVTVTTSYSINVRPANVVDYTITFYNNPGNSDSAEISATGFFTYSTASYTLVEQGQNGLFENDAVEESKCYASRGLKMGSGSASGYFVATPLTAAKYNIIAITINSTQYGSDNGKLVLTLDGTQITNNITPGTSYTYQPNNAISSIEEFKLGTTANRAYINSITFTIDTSLPIPKTLSSIAVKTPPTTTTYTTGDYFNPAGLEITLSYSDGTTDDVTYANHETDFTFSPALDAALTTSNTEVTITYGGKSCTQEITVNSGGDPVLVQKTVTLTFTSACSGSGTDDKGNTWTVTSDAAESTYDGTKGIHYGTGSKAVSYINLTTTITCVKITSVVVNCSGASGTAGQVSVTIGNASFGGAAQNITASAANYTFTGEASGAIIVSITQASAKKALYCKQIVVTYWVYE